MTTRSGEVIGLLTDEVYSASSPSPCCTESAMFHCLASTLPRAVFFSRQATRGKKIRDPLEGHTPSSHSE